MAPVSSWTAILWSRTSQRATAVSQATSRAELMLQLPTRLATAATCSSTSRTSPGSNDSRIDCSEASSSVSTLLVVGVVGAVVGGRGQVRARLYNGDRQVVVDVPVHAG